MSKSGLAFVNTPSFESKARSSDHEICQTTSHDCIHSPLIHTPERVERKLQWLNWRVEKNGDTSIQLRRVTVRASGYRLLRPWYRLFHLGWAGPIWFSKKQPGSEQNDGT